MELQDLVGQIPRFVELTHPERIKIFGWYLHTHRNRHRFNIADVRLCYNEIGLRLPSNISQDCSRLEDRGELLKYTDGFRLEWSVREELNSKYGEHEVTIAVRQLLSDLPGKISNQGEKLFLTEAISCYRHRAFRAAIVMSWNLAYDHLLNWILVDATRLADFNVHIAGRIGAKRAAAITIARREDFEDLKEAEVVDICGSASLFGSDNVKKILHEQLNRRNMAAHPSLVVIGPSQAEDAITSLVSNVVLRLR
jgi:hypothetical protein